uniref:Cytochrome b561 domain-containing protein n=1 Tax=Angiostrongylus cantonensis TaxID=6313 RepID=A0A0K0DEM1_ANGCA
MEIGIKWPSEGDNGGINFHGMFMSTGLVFFQGEALLSHRMYRYDNKVLSKFIHTVFHLLAIGFFSTALAAMILQKNANVRSSLLVSTLLKDTKKRLRQKKIGQSFNQGSRKNLLKSDQEENCVVKNLSLKKPIEVVEGRMLSKQ